MSISLGNRAKLLENVSIRILQGRLVELMRKRVSRGELSERGLAALTGVSQPHIHNVLKGTRLFSSETMDQILDQLRLDILDLIDQRELQELLRRRVGGSDRWREISLLKGRIGPAFRFPTVENFAERRPFDRFLIERLESPVAARLAHDPAAAPLFLSCDVVLLDRSERQRSHPEEEGFYLVRHQNVGLIRRLRIEGGQLGLIAPHAEAGSPPADSISLEDGNILDVVKAKVVWIGRRLEMSPLAARSPEEAG